MVPNAKTSERERAGHQRGGGGPPPATLCVRAFSRESLDPPPGTGREATSQVLTCGGSNGTTCQGRHGAAYPLGGRRGSHLEAQRPVAPPARRGVPISPEKWGERGPGLCPWTPGFDDRSLSLAGFWDRCLWYVRGAVTSGILKPIWDAFSRKNMLKSIFAKESSQIRVRRWAP